MRVITRSLDGLKVEVVTGQHTLVADEPDPIGTDAGPSPYDLLLAALGTCTVMTLHIYARRKQWPLEAVEVRLDTRRVHGADVETCEVDENARVDLIERELVLRGPLDDEQRQRLAEIADKCPVHRTMRGITLIETKLLDA